MVLVKVAVAPFVELVNPAAGPGLTVIKFEAVAVLAPRLLLTVSVTVYAPGVLYTTLGFCAVELEGFPPGNDQLYAVGAPLEVLVNCTVSGPQPLVGAAVKLATGGASRETVWVEVVLPQSLVEVSVTV